MHPVTSNVSRCTVGKGGQPDRIAERIRHAAQEVYVLLLHHEIVIVNGDDLIGSRTQTQRFDLDVPVVKVRRKIGIISLNSQRRRLRGNANRRESNDEKRGGKSDLICHKQVTSLSEQLPEMRPYSLFGQAATETPER